MKFLIVFYFAVLLVSCGKNECDSACDPLIPVVNFKIVNGSGVNLVSGPGKIYSLSNLSIKSMVGTTLVTDSLAFNGDANQATTPLAFAANPQVSQYYLYINGIKTDSFQVNYQSNQGRTDCCPPFTSITALKVNNVATSYVFPGSANPVNVTK